MTAIADLSDLINRATGGNSGTPEYVHFYKQARVAGAAAVAVIAGRPHSLWRYEGNPSGASVPGTSGVAIDNGQAAAIKFTSPTGGRQSWLTNFWAGGSAAGTFILYDRLLHNGGLSATTTTAQNVGGTLTRYTDGVGNFAFAEIYTLIGTTATTFTINYTNELGASGRASVAAAIGATSSREVGRIIFVPLNSADRGIRAIASTTVLATTGTAGSFGLTIGHPLAICSVNLSGGSGWRDFATGLPGIPEIVSGACLSLLYIPTATVAPEVHGGYSKVEA